MKITIELYDDTKDLQDNFENEVTKMMVWICKRLTDELLEPCEKPIRSINDSVIGELKIENDYE